MRAAQGESESVRSSVPGWRFSPPFRLPSSQCRATHRNTLARPWGDSQVPGPSDHRAPVSSTTGATEGSLARTHAGQQLGQWEGGPGCREGNGDCWIFACRVCVCGYVCVCVRVCVGVLCVLTENML